MWTPLIISRRLSKRIMDCNWVGLASQAKTLGRRL